MGLAKLLLNFRGLVVILGDLKTSISRRLISAILPVTFKCFMSTSEFVFQHLVLLEMISFEKEFKTTTQKFVI